MKSRITILLFSILVSGCKQEVSPPPEVATRYFQNIDRFCHAIVNCMKEDVRKRLSDQPERRDMVIARMDRDLCQKEQYRLIGSLSVKPHPDRPRTDQEIYSLYDSCVQAIAAASDCSARLDLYRNNPSCIAIRQ